MTLGTLIPTAGQIKQIQGIEAQLLRRRRTGTIGFVTGLTGAILQIIVIARDSAYLNKLGDFFHNLIRGDWETLITAQDIPALLGVLVLVVGFGIYFLFRRTSFLQKESGEPFRYTFWIEPFNRVKDTPNKRFVLKEDDRFHLLHHDLAERLDDRIRRFSLLEELSSVSQENLTSHIHINGDYAIREEKKDEWVIHVMPRVRVGSSNRPITLACPVKFPLNRNKNENRKEDGANSEALDSDSKDFIYMDIMDANRYNQVVERVYSSIATEVYRQIESDVKDKMALFPTSYLRAVALFHEAEDFARSNTVDAYDHAIGLYREARRYFRISNIKWMTKALLKCPILWRFEAKFLHMQTKVQVGHAKCLIYRRQISALTGRYSNPLFEVRDDLDEATHSLEKLHQKMIRFGENSRSSHLLAFLTFPQDSWFRYLLFRPLQPLFDEQKDLLFETYIVDALAYYFLDAIKKAKEYLNHAMAVEPQKSERNALYLLAQGLIEPELDREILIFRKTTEKAPNFQIAQYFLAYYSEMEFRAKNEITKERAKSVIDEYERVLKINPGNVAALAAQGYLFWLLGDLEEAKNKFGEGCEIKALVRETFIGELYYGLARIAAEEGRLNASYDLYNEAISADPGVGAFSATASLRVNASYYDYIVPTILERYCKFRNTMNKFHKGKQKLFSINTKLQSDLESGRITTDFLSVCQNKGIYLFPTATVLTEQQKGCWRIENGGRIYNIRQENSKLNMYLTLKAADGEVSKRVLNTIRSFALNDHGNACLNYFLRYGDNSKLRLAIREFEEAIKENRENAVAKYNLNIAYRWRQEEGDEEKAMKYLAEVVESVPTWRAAVISLAKPLVKSRIKDKKEEIKKLKENIKQAKEEIKQAKEAIQLEKIRARTKGTVIERESPLQATVISHAKISVESRINGKKEEIKQAREAIKVEKNREQTERTKERIRKAECPADIRDQQDLMMQLRVRVSEKQKEENELGKNLQKLEDALEKVFNDAIDSIIDNTRLSPLFEGLDSHYKRLNQLLDNKRIMWGRMDENDAQALREWANILLENNDNEVALRASERLCNHILNEYYPENFDVNSIRKEALVALSPLDKKSRKLPFSIELKHAKDFDDCRISEELRHVFIQNRISLSQEVTITIREPNSQWLISDQDKAEMYLVTSEEDQLIVSDAEIEKCNDVMRYRIENWLKMDPIYFVSWIWHQEYFGVLRQRDILHKALQIEQSNRKYHHTLSRLFSGKGALYLRDKKYREAIESYKTAMEIEPNNKELFHGFTNIYNTKGNDLFLSEKYAEAIAEYEEAIKLDPTCDIYYCNLATAYEKSKVATSLLEALDKAIYCYQKARDINPKDQYTFKIDSLITKRELVPYYSERSLEMLPTVTPIAIEVAANLIALVESEGNSSSPPFQGWINLMRGGLHHELGHVILPRVQVRKNETDLPDGTYIIMINEIPVVSGNVPLDKILCDDTVDRLALKNIKGEEAVNPANGSECAWIPSEFNEKAEKAGLTTWDALGYMTLHLSSVIRKNFAEFVTIQTVTDQIKAEAKDYYEKISEARGGLSRFTEILRIFAEEEVAIKELETICKSYIELTQKNIPVYEIVEELRCHEVIRPLLHVNRSDHRLEAECRTVFELGDDIVDLINKGIITNDDAALLALEPEPTQKILTAVRNEVGNLAPTAQNPVIMTEDWRIRRHIRKLVELEFPYLAVMSKREIMKKVKTIATITLD